MEVDLSRRQTGTPWMKRRPGTSGGQVRGPGRGTHTSDRLGQNPVTLRGSALHEGRTGRSAGRGEAGASTPTNLQRTNTGVLIMKPALLTLAAALALSLTGTADASGRGSSSGRSFSSSSGRNFS